MNTCTRIAAALCLLVAPVLAAARAAGPVGWGADINPGEGPKLIESVRGDLAAIVKAPQAQRAALVKAFVEKSGESGIEAVKRFRNPELHDLFVALLDHPSWKVRHRALFALESYDDPADVARAAAHLAAEAPRLREKAALTVLDLWPERGDPPGAADVRKTVEARLAAEPDRHVRACLEALAARMAGKLSVQRASTEFCVTGPDGLKLTPFLEGMDKAAAVAPGWRPAGLSQSGGGDASKHGAAPSWTTPVLGYGDEEVQGSLQPFANLRQNGTVHHTGQDVGCSLDGAGFYACADGVVRFVHSGSDMGTLLVLQHSPDGKSLVNAVYMHGGDLVFVKGGDRVRAGQLVGTMGMGFSLENGGHFSHLHFGMYPGAFSATHNYGYKPVSAGLADWYDPAKFLPQWILRTRPAVGDLRPMDAALAKAVDAARGEDLARALREIDAVLARKDVTDAQRADAETLRAAVLAGPAEIVKRAEATRDMGYPSDALAGLQAAAPHVKGVPGEDAVTSALGAWPKDAAFRRALDAERQFDAAETAAARLAGKKENAEKVAALWRKLLDEFGDTCLRGRIEERLAAK